MGATRRFGSAIVCAVAALLLSASAADAAARFASPSGTSADPCTQASPCDIATAVNMAMADDDVTIEPGTYGPLTTTLNDGFHTLTIHGQAGAPRPVLNFSTASAGFILFGTGTTLTNVEVMSSTMAGPLPSASAAGPGDRRQWPVPEAACP